MVKTPELWRGRTGSTVPFGLKDGRLWFVTDVPSGLECGCRCPDPNCDKPLVARNRPSPDRQRAYNFMHSTRTTICGGRESALHRMAKEVLMGANAMMLPQWTDGVLTIPASELILESGTSQEVRILNGQLRPDIKVSGQLKRAGLPSLYVEVKVSHAVDWKKAAKARENGISIIEIDVSGASDEQVADHNSFRKMVLEDVSNRSWVHLGDGQFLSTLLEEDVYEVKSSDTTTHELPSKKGNIFLVTKQNATVYRAGAEPRQLDFEIADTFQGNLRTDGNGNALPYSPGLYTLAPSRPPAYSWGASQFYKTFLRPIRIRTEQKQSQLFNEIEV